MILTNDQEKALKIILDRYKNREKYVTICGYAGTGKSTLVRFAVSALNIAEDKVVYACYTGKAAEVLRKKGNKNAMTLHRLLYDSIPKAGGGFMRIPKKSLDYTLIIADECSMIPKSMVDMLLRHNAFTIFLGDNFQLPQINKEESQDLLEHPHIFLTQVMRQAAESEIIRLTMDIREGKDLSYFDGKEVKVIPRQELSTGMMTWADEILTATNSTRHSINAQMREILGFKGILESGEKIICKRNYWNDCNSNGDALVNGIVGKIESPFESFTPIPRWIKTSNHTMPIIQGTFIPEGTSEFEQVRMDKNFIINEEACIDWRVSYQLGKLKPKIGDIVPKQFTYAYAITTHAAQGSEWDKVLVIEEPFPYDKIEHARWLYTACTRAASRLVLVR